MWRRRSQQTTGAMRDASARKHIATVKMRGRTVYSIAATVCAGAAQPGPEAQTLNFGHVPFARPSIRRCRAAGRRSTTGRDTMLEIDAIA
jgi:hypothetical protein